MTQSAVRRIVSLIASSTEIVCALGLERDLVGRSHECDFPPTVKTLPVCTSPKFNVDGSSYEIDQRVKAILQESLSVYRVDAALLDKLQPSHIITQAQCEVCAVSLKDVEEAACQMVSSQPQIITLEPNCLSDIFVDIERVGAGLGERGRSEKLIATMKDRITKLNEMATDISETPSVVCIEWIDPLMTAGNWMPELVKLAGGTNMLGEAGKHSPPISFEQLASAAPDIIIVSPCGFDVARTLEEMPLLTNNPIWQSLAAVKNDRVFVADGNQFFNRPGPRVVESLEIMAEILHPEHFQFGHDGSGYIHFH